MWRQQLSPANQDSDQSISEDDFPQNYVPLATIEDTKHENHEIQISSRLELLKAHVLEQNFGRKSSNLPHEEHKIFTREGFQKPEFHNGSSFNFNSDEEVISDDEGNDVLSKSSAMVGVQNLVKEYRSRNGETDGPNPWSDISKEVGTLMHLTENAPCNLKTNRTAKGVKCKGKPKFSFGFQSHKDTLFFPSTSKDENYVSLCSHEVPQRLDTTELKTGDNVAPAEPLEDILGDDENQLDIVSIPAEVEALGRGRTGQSMSELLDGLHDGTSLQRRNSEYSRTRQKRVRPFVEKSVRKLGHRMIDSEDSPNLMDGGSSSDGENNNQFQKLVIPETTRQTILDQFQEALGANFVNDDGPPLRFRLFEKLQQIMQGEKERDLNFLRKLHGGISQNEPSCIKGKIMSRYLDARLTVCRCSFSGNLESFARSDSPAEKVNEVIIRTVIFNPRLRNDVDLEIGNCIRIHPPWKEVQVGNNRSIILSDYFSQIPVDDIGSVEKVLL